MPNHKVGTARKRHILLTATCEQEKEKIVKQLWIDLTFTTRSLIRIFANKTLDMHLPDHMHGYGVIK